MILPVPHKTITTKARLVYARNIVRRDTPAARRRCSQPASQSVRSDASRPRAHALSLLDPLDGGELRWRGKFNARVIIPRYRLHVAYIRQRPELLDRTVEDNLGYPYTLGAKFDDKLRRRRTGTPRRK